MIAVVALIVVGVVLMTAAVAFESALLLLVGISVACIGGWKFSDLGDDQW